MRDIFDMNSDWRFHRGEIAFRNRGGIHAERYAAAEWMKAGNQGVAQADYPDDSWEPVDLPHDFVIDSGFTEDANVTHGSLMPDVGWYRKSFELPEADRERRLRLEFDGVYRDCQVWLNGQFVGRHLSGYTGFSFDITALCNFGGVNTLAVRADAREFELWSYEGGGIYRDVRLVKTDPLHIEPDGVWVRSEVADDETQTPAAVTPTVSLANAQDKPAAYSVCVEIKSAAGDLVASAEGGGEAEAFGRVDHELALEIATPKRWSIDDPHLYTMVTSIKAGGRLVDRAETAFGIRSVRFDADRGFFLNGQPLKLKGVCNHQDHAGVGIAVPPALDEWRILQLKKMGCNALRTSHNPPSPYVLDACDRHGVLVLDEQRQSGASREHLDQLASLIKRDRNHPSVFAWSVGNEEMNIQHTTLGAQIFRRMQDLCHHLDPTRPVTYATNCQWLNVAKAQVEDGFRFDVFGANYVCREHRNVTGDMYDEFHETYPDYPLLATETGGSSSTRGLYRKEDATPGLEFWDMAWWTNPRRQGVISAYGETATPWGYSVDQTWKDCIDRPFVAGTFLWTGFDYRGETFPAKWPAVVTCYGLMDLCGFPKDAFHYYRAWWCDEPVLHLFPHWNWAGLEGQNIDVWCYSNCTGVELLLNGQSLGRREMPRHGHLEWEVPYQPGRLEAIGYGPAGEVSLREARETTGPVHTTSLRSGRTTWSADARDVLPVEVQALDADGRFVATADTPIRFEVEGPARVLGVGNGDPCSHESDRASERRLFHGLCQVILISTGGPGEVTVRAHGPGIETAALKLTAVPAGGLAQIKSTWKTPGAESATQENLIDNTL